MKKKIPWKLILTAAGVLASAAFYIRSSDAGQAKKDGLVITAAETAAAEAAENRSTAASGTSGEAENGTGGNGRTAQAVTEPEASEEESGFTEKQKAELREIMEACLEEQLQAQIGETLKTALEEQMKSLTENGTLAEAAAAYISRQSSLININTADQEELKKLTGIGEARAAAILAWREANGGFQSLEDLLKVKGITEKILAGLREEATV